MTHWNYRIVKYRPGVKVAPGASEDCYGLHEVYYNSKGEPWAMTSDPRGFIGETPEELIDALNMALRDAQERPVLEEPEEWAAND